MTEDKYGPQENRPGVGSPEHRAWSGAHNRCKNPRNQAYAYYGGRGISVCKHWDTFEAFISDMGPRPTPKHSLDRIDNDGNYEPGNCRWATSLQQNQNRRHPTQITTTVPIYLNGRVLTAKAWAKVSGIPATTITHRFTMLGWPAHQAIHHPVGKPRVKTKYRHEPRKIPDHSALVALYGEDPPELHERLIEALPLVQAWLADGGIYGESLDELVEFLENGR